MMTLNSARRESTGFSPAYLNFGHELRIPIPSVLEKEQDENPNHCEMDDRKVAHRYTECLRQLQETFELVRINLSRTFEKYITTYDTANRPAMSATE